MGETSAAFKSLGNVDVLIDMLIKYLIGFAKYLAPSLISLGGNWSQPVDLYIGRLHL